MSTPSAVAESPASPSLTVGGILRRVFSFPVALGSLLTFVAAGLARFGVLDTDTWWHAKIGEQIARTHRWPTTDIFSFTMTGTPWIAYEWLGEVIIALSARLHGLQGEVALLMCLSASLVLLLYIYASLRSGHSKAAFVASALVVVAVAPFLTLRPQLIGYNFLLLTLICLELFRQGHRRALWVLPPLFLVWVNVHGTFVFGLAIIGLYWLSGLVGFRAGGLAAERWTAQQGRDLLLTALLCMLVLPLTPYGTRVAAYPLELAFRQPANIANIQEWQPLGFNLTLGRYLLGLLVFYFVGYAVVRPQHRLEEMVLFLLGFVAACLHIRFIAFFLLMFTPLLAALLAQWVPPYEPQKDRWAINAALVAGLVFGLVYLFPSARTLQDKTAERYPVRALEFLRQHPVAGPTFNMYGWGGYLIWATGPAQKVFLDGRADIYEYGGVLSDYIHITLIESDALPLLRKYGIQSCLLEQKAPLTTLLRALPDWRVVYSDDLSTVLVRVGDRVPNSAPPGRSSAVPSTTVPSRPAELAVRPGTQAPL